MPLPNIDEANRKKPLCYDAVRKKFILFDEIVAGKEKIIPVDTLSDDDLRKLVIARLRAGPDFKVQAISGPPHSRDDVVREIEQNEPFGQMHVEAEKAYLREFLDEIQRNLEEKRKRGTKGGHD